MLKENSYRTLDTICDKSFVSNDNDFSINVEVVPIYSLFIVEA